MKTNKTIKIIDIFNKIANGEEVPKQIWYSDNKWEFNKNDFRYHNKTFNYPCKDDLDLSTKFGIMSFSYLNDEVEIIEEDNEKAELKPFFEFFKDFKAEDENYNLFTCYEQYLEKLSKEVIKLIDIVNDLRGDE